MSEVNKIFGPDGELLVIQEGSRIELTPAAMASGIAVQPGVVYVPGADVFYEKDTGKVIPGAHRTGFLGKVSYNEIFLGLGILAIVLLRPGRKS